MDSKIGRVIAIEEAFQNKFVSEKYPAQWQQATERMTQGKLFDVGEERIARMDEAGIDFQILSLSSPGVQTFDLQTAEELGGKSNDWLAGIIEKYPQRFGAFASLPTQDGRRAADELEKRVKQNFAGALINGHTDGKLIDDKHFWPIYERAQALDVPIYLHPANAPQPIIDTYYKDHPELVGAAWGWAVDVATQTLRMMVSGVFDEFPKLKFIIGHMGELIPFHLQRITKATSMQNKKMKKTVAEYMQTNVWITTSGVFEHAALTCALSTLGIDRILFSVDDPFASNEEAMRFLKTTPLSDEDRRKLAHGNAERIMKLPF